MRGFWAGIGLVAACLIVFVAAREGKTALAQTTQHLRRHFAASSGGRPDSDFPFRLDGERLGRIVRMHLKRERAGQPVSGSLLVALDRSRAARLLGDCDLVPARAGDDLGMDHGFRCAEPEETGLTRVASVRFEPSGLVRPLKVRDRDLRDLRRGEAFDLSMDLDEGVHLQGRGADGARFNIAAGEDGAAIRVDGADGEQVRLSADSNGAFLVVRDKDGGELFRLRAGGRGLSISGKEVRDR